MVSLLLLILLNSFTAELSSASAPVPSDDTKEVIIEMALENIKEQYNPEQYRFSLSARWIPGSLLKTSADHIRSVELQGIVQRYSKFEVSYKLQDGRLNTIDIQLLVEAQQMLPVAQQRLISGRELEATDFDRRWVSIDIGRDEPVADMNRLTGKTLKRMVNAGEPVYASEISEPYLVEAGEEIELLYTEHGIEIVLTCESRKSGTEGEEIPIYCKETRRKYLGKITGPGVVQWQKTK